MANPDLIIEKRACARLLSMPDVSEAELWDGIEPKIIDYLLDEGLMEWRVADRCQIFYVVLGTHAKQKARLNYRYATVKLFRNQNSKKHVET